MKLKLIVLSFLSLLAIGYRFLSLPTHPNTEHWAVIVAGSNGFWNYRHQADACHAYQTLLLKGLSADHIILFAYDDIAASEDNPIPGKLYNRPTYDKPGQDVYEGCKIDYRGEDVTPANYLKVLKGDAAGMKGIGSGKVLQSTKNDRVFLNFADHGAPGLVGFPNEYLYADDLVKTLVYMHEHSMYKELVYYMEACESGSMFLKLPTNISIYATTAANSHESSWVTYCEPDDKVNGTEIGSCLGDLYSVKWLENTDKVNVCQETLEQQFAVVKNETNLSHVMEWGDLSLKEEASGDYISNCEINAGNNGFLETDDEIVEEKGYKSIDVRDVKLMYLERKHRKNPTAENLMALEKEKEQREFFDEKVSALAKRFGFGYAVSKTYDLRTPSDIDFECLKGLVTEFESRCARMSEYALKHVRVFAHMCSFLE